MQNVGAADREATKHGLDTALMQVFTGINARVLIVFWESCVPRFAPGPLFVENLGRGRKIVVVQKSYCGSTGRANRDGRREERQIWPSYK